MIAVGRHASRRARVMKLHQGEEAADLCLVRHEHRENTPQTKRLVD